MSRCWRLISCSECAKKKNKQIQGFEPAAVQALQEYDWPGNVRELQNVVERAVLLGKGPLLGLQDLPAHVASCSSSTLTIRPTGGPQTLKDALEGPERQIILQSLRDNNWNRNVTADQLGINRTTLYKKMKKLGLEDPRGSAAPLTSQSGKTASFDTTQPPVA